MGVEARGVCPCPAGELDRSGTPGPRRCRRKGRGDGDGLAVGCAGPGELARPRIPAEDAGRCGEGDAARGDGSGPAVPRYDGLPVTTPGAPALPGRGGGTAGAPAVVGRPGTGPGLAEEPRGPGPGVPERPLECSRGLSRGAGRLGVIARAGYTPRPVVPGGRRLGAAGVNNIPGA